MHFFAKTQYGRGGNTGDISEFTDKVMYMTLSVFLMMVL